MFSGAITAMVTPFRNGRLDEARLTEQVEHQIEQGIDGLVPVGTTGESPTLTFDEHKRVIELTVKLARGRVPVIAGVGANATSEAIELHRFAREVGASAGLSVNPYYNKPSQEGLYRHFMKVAEAVKIPIMLYSIPGRCGVEIAVPTVVRLAKDTNNIVAIKEAGGSVERVSQLRQALPDHFEILSGDDSLTLPFMAVGASGVVSVASNLIPKEVSEMVESALAGDWQEARVAHERLYGVFKDLLSIDVNPVPIKMALAMRGLMEPEFRLPLCEPLPEIEEKIRELLQKLQLSLA